MVDGKIIGQGGALNRGVLTQAVISRHAPRAPIAGNHVFGKATCQHCNRAKGYLDAVGIPHTYRDVVTNPGDLYEMLAQVKPIVEPKTPVTVPQIWIYGRYVDGADKLEKTVARSVEPNPECGRCSISSAF